MYLKKKHHEVPQLSQLCIKFLQKNVDALGYVGDVPKELLSKIIQNIQPEQLAKIETMNPGIDLGTEELWKKHCYKKFVVQSDDEKGEQTWKDFYKQKELEMQEKVEAMKNRLKDMYYKAAEDKKNRQIQVIPARKSKVTASNFRFSNHTIPVSTPKGQLMKKTISEFNKSVTQAPTVSVKKITTRAPLSNLQATYLNESQQQQHSIKANTTKPSSTHATSRQNILPYTKLSSTVNRQLPNTLNKSKTNNHSSIPIKPEPKSMIQQSTQIKRVTVNPNNNHHILNINKNIVKTSTSQAATKLISNKRSFSQMEPTNAVLDSEPARKKRAL